MAILGRRDRGARTSDAENAGSGGGPALDPHASEALALAAERTGELVRAARETLRALDSARAATDRASGVKAGLIESLADVARQLHSEGEELSRRLAAARRDLGEEPASSTPAESAPQPQESQEAQEEAKAPEPQAGPPQPPSPGVRALVTQMAAFGSTRLEIEERLRDEFGVTNAAAAVAHVLDGAED